MANPQILVWLDEDNQTLHFEAPGANGARKKISTCSMATLLDAEDSALAAVYTHFLDQRESRDIDDKWTRQHGRHVRDYQAQKAREEKIKQEALAKARSNRVFNNVLHDHGDITAARVNPELALKHKLPARVTLNVDDLDVNWNFQTAEQIANAERITVAPSARKAGSYQHVTLGRK